MKKSKPQTVPRLHDVKVDEIVEKGLKTVQSSKLRIKRSKALINATRQCIEEDRLKKRGGERLIPHLILGFSIAPMIEYKCYP